MTNMIAIKKTYKIIFILLFIACEDEHTPPTISNDTTVLKESEMYLYGWYNNKYQINLHWQDGYGCDNYKISIDGLEPEIIGPDIQTYHYIFI